MKILTAAEMSAADRTTAERFGVPFGELMEHAGTAVAKFARQQYPTAKNILILAGTGNNGGDGLVAARVLLQSGCNVEVFLLGDVAKLKGDAAAAYESLDRSVVRILADKTAIKEALPNAIREADVLLDALVGTGFTPPLRGPAAVARDIVADTTILVIAVDLPSGWDANFTETYAEGAFRANAVVTFTAPKLAHAFGHLTAPNVFGPVVIAPIGSPDAAIASEQKLTWTGTAKHIFESPRPFESNKGMYGHVLLIGGAAGKAGAPSMASLAALRAGAGLVTAAVPQSILNTVALITPELMTHPLTEDATGSVALANLGTKDQWLKKISVLAIGPGLGTEGEASEFVRRLVLETDIPFVLDADALNAFKGQTEKLKEASRNGTRTIVLTPHPGEMGTLLGITAKQVQADRLNLARSFAQQHGVTLVLKGARTLVAHPDGSVAVNTTGNPSMAKGGSGDILTGIIAACLAQKTHQSREAIEAAVYLHGLAGDFASRQMDEHTVLATDTVAHLSGAFRYRTSDNIGEWICGLHD
ncbi:NAD(P)H-hydrate dehydratase [Terriglobus sp. RCC_193]|uniref:NAD(P)H-hydrate dehydratase n=1 Tax=Terriglobus sp. RCC_193 TaxID=3239218 RepID=UPI0035246662